MTGDIVDRLRDADQRCWCGARMAGECMCDLLWPGGANEVADEIERLRLLGGMLVNAANFLLDGADPTEDLADVLAAWEGDPP